MSLMMDGILAVGYGEKCPFCELIVVEKTNVLKHMIDNHPNELEKKLFREEK